MSHDTVRPVAALDTPRAPSVSAGASALRPPATELLPYPAQLVRLWRSRSGRSVLIRPVAHSDRDHTEAFIRALSPISRFNRFLGGIASLGTDTLDRATRIDYVHHMALLALVLDGSVEREVGAVRYVGTGIPGRCEFALAVADGWQREGIGSELLRALMVVAAGHGFTSIKGDAFATNVQMLGLARKLAFEITAVAGEPTLRRLSRAPATC